ncbi:glycosyltransferase [Aquabacter sp. CN5-332]|uniref:glycosyltransferase n=1 Tax=Aquabacter sp. CN5-332 TaxID=3156608 RepID=UPI0032B59D71
MLGEAAPRRKSTLRADAEPHPASRSWPAEIAALRGHFPDGMLRRAQRRAHRLGIGADEVLLHAGLAEPEELAAAFAAHLGLPLADPSAPLRLAPEQAPSAIRTGLITEPFPEGPHHIVAPRGKDVRRLARALAENPARAHRMSLTSPEALRDRLGKHARIPLAHAAAYELKDTEPHLSAATVPRGFALGLPLALAGLIFFSAWLFAPALAQLVSMCLLSLLFLCAMGLRLAGCMIPPHPDPPPRMEDRHLPVYTVIVPLYREAVMLPRLEAALRALDYPPEKLDIKLVVEPDDPETRDAILRRALPPSFETIVAPPVGPRTKPKALNAALPFARGKFIAVFDAEDIPDPGQLRAALAAFERGGNRVACVQARLAMDNAQDSWISRHFALEYCGQFDVLLPALAALRLPILLGGTSNHFRRAALERAGGWDPYNVTEDADLGLRLARMGWDIEVIASDTLEEAPVTTRAWLRQRTRWMKGWAQTIMVHGRNPRRFLRDLGPHCAAAAALLTISPFAAMLVHPISLAVLLGDLWRGTLGSPATSTVEALTYALSYVNLMFGYVAAIIIALVGLWRRRRLSAAPVLLTLPAYWLLQSVAIWRALVDLVVDPYRWDKTEHGLARRRQTQPVKGSGAARPQRRPASALH